MVAMALIRAGSSVPTTGLPSFPAPSAIISQASPYWTDGHGYLTRTSSIADPAGGTAAERYTSNTSSSLVHSQFSLGGFTTSQPSSGSYPSGVTLTASVLVKQVGTSARYIRFNHYDGGTLGGDAGASFDLQSASVVGYRAGGVTESNSGIVNYGSGWYQIWYSFPTIASGDIASHQLGFASISASDGNFDAGGNSVTIGDGVDFFRYQIVSGTDPNG
jgi:hypothetical protein